MQKLVGRPIIAPFCAIFGLAMVRLGYGTFTRGYTTYIPKHGAPQIISASTRPSVYWALSAGSLALGVSLLALSAYALVALWRVIHVGDFGELVRPRAIDLVRFGISVCLIAAAVLLTLCSHH